MSVFVLCLGGGGECARDRDTQRRRAEYKKGVGREGEGGGGRGGGAETESDLRRKAERLERENESGERSDARV